MSDLVATVLVLYSCRCNYDISRVTVTLLTFIRLPYDLAPVTRSCLRIRFRNAFVESLHAPARTLVSPTRQQPAGASV